MRGAGPGARTSEPGVPGYPFELLEAKLTRPFTRPGTVVRPGLVNRLRASRVVPVVAVVAPPGYGKTTVLGLWAEADKRSFAWVSLEESENNAISLLTYIAAALERSESLGARVLESLSMPGGRVEATVVPRLGSALSARSDPVVLVLDDVHRLTNPVCKSAIVALSRHLRHGSQLVLAGRQEPEIPLARFRAEGRLLEVGTNDLALDLDEARELIRGTGFQPSPSEIEHLHRQTEGWPAGLYLSGLSLRAQHGRGGRPSFEGSDRFAVDYLWSELLSHLSPADIDFLTRSSILARMCGPLCDAVVGGSAGAKALHDLERSNRFVVALDRRRHWYRFHRLFREVLNAELEKRRSDLVPELHRRAARWLESNGLPEEAFGHWLAVGATDRAAELIEALAVPMMRKGRLTRLHNWLNWLPEDAFVDHPSLVTTMVLVGALSGDTSTAERWADVAERSPLAQLPNDDTAFPRAPVHMFRALMCRRGAAQMLEDARIAESLEPKDSPWRTAALMLLGVATLLNGDWEAADRLLAQAVDGGPRANAWMATSAALAECSFIAMARQRWDEAGKHVHEALDMVDDGRLQEFGGSAMTYAASARLALQAGDVPRAQREFNRAQRLLPALMSAIPWAAVQTRLELARVNLGLSDPAGARALLSEAEEIVAQRPDLGTLGGEVSNLRQLLDSLPRPGLPGPSSLTTAELRVLAFLPSYLSFAEIGQRLHLSPNTVKTEAISVYRKLGVSSRSEAVEGASRIGLLNREPISSFVDDESGQAMSSNGG